MGAYYVYLQTWVLSWFRRSWVADQTVLFCSLCFVRTSNSEAGHFQWTQAFLSELVYARARKERKIVGHKFMRGLSRLCPLSERRSTSLLHECGFLRMFERPNDVIRSTVRYVATITFLIIVLGKPLVINDSLSFTCIYVYVCCWPWWVGTLKAGISKLKCKAWHLIMKT